MIYENVTFKFNTPLITEEVTRKGEGETLIKETKIKGIALPPSTSRNERTYTFEEIQKADITGGTISLNHTEDVTDNVGVVEFIKTDNGLEYSATIYDTGKHPYVTDMLNKKLIRNVSIEAIAQNVEDDGKGNMVVKGLDITGLGLVKTPGIIEQTLNITESLEKAINKNHARNDLTETDNKELNKNENTGDNMAEEIIKKKEEPSTEQEEEITKTPEVPEKKEEPNKDAEEALKTVKALKEELDVMRKELNSVKETPSSKGKVTEDIHTPITLKKIPNKKGGVDLYHEESFLY